MAITGIIAEYNPFHNGHRYQIQKIKDNDATAKLICVMSGNMTQRGEPAILNKWQRAQLAVKNGIDLVIELPAVYSIRSAQDFAHGGVALLHRLGIVEKLVFGAETNDLSLLHHLAESIDQECTKTQLKYHLQQGCSYAAALSQAIASQDANISEPILKEPNTILAIEYLRALHHMKATITPVVIQRIQAHYTDTSIHGAIASGSAIRTALGKKLPDFQQIRNTVSAAAFAMLLQAYETNNLPDTKYLTRLLLGRLYQMPLHELQSIYSINEGLEYKILAAAGQTKSIQSFCNAVKSKRYPLSRIQRIVCYILMGLSKQSIQDIDISGPLYARILAFNDTGRTLLRHIKEQSTLPIITKTSHFLTTKNLQQASLSPLQKMLAQDVLAANLYTLCFKSIPPAMTDFTTSPLYIK